MSQEPSPLAQPAAWDLVASGYAAEIVPQLELFAKDALDLAGVVAGERVVDVACGPGTLSFLAATRGALVSALDFSESMLEMLRERAAREGVAGIEDHQGDGQELPFPDERFDAGFSMFGLMMFPDRSRGFAELCRVLRPGGRAVVGSWQPMEKVPPLLALFAALQELLPGLPFGPGPTPLGTVDEMREEMRAGGFTTVTVHTPSHTAEAPSLDAWWQMILRSMAPVALLRQRLGEEDFARVAAGVHERLLSRFGPGPVQMTMYANLGLGIR